MLRWGPDVAAQPGGLLRDRLVELVGPDVVARIRELAGDGALSQAEIGRRCGVSEFAVRTALGRAGARTAAAGQPEVPQPPPAAGGAGAGRGACPACGREPATRGEALQQREDLAIVWLHLDGDRVTEARHCVACQPHGPVIDVSCSCCGNGPLITGQPPGLGDQLAPPALDWLHSRGWQLHPRPLCPAEHR